MTKEPTADVTTRRHFLATLATAAVCGCTGSSASPASFGTASAGNVSDIEVGSLTVVGSEPVMIGRDAGGLYAMTITCTHQGCDVEPTGSGSSVRVRCPCHGSAFDRNGAVTHGPANAPLAHFAVEVDASGNVTIRGDKQVGADVRTAVPT